MRTDPSDNGGLFVGRRPGTAPVRYRTPPERGDKRRRRLDELLAAAILLVMTVVGASFWGPIPAAWLWISARVQLHVGLGLALLVAFLGILLTLLAGLVALRALDDTWLLVRRAAGHDQREGALGTIFAVSAAVGIVAFMIWLVFVGGLSPSFAPT